MTNQFIKMRDDGFDKLICQNETKDMSHVISTECMKMQDKTHSLTQSS